MKLTIILSSNQAETNWNALRLANHTLGKGDTVHIFLIGEGVEYEKLTSAQFDISSLSQKFQNLGGKMKACGTCLTHRNQAETQICPAGSMEDVYRLIVESDRVLTF